MNDSNFIIKNDKQYESIEQSFLNVYKNDLIIFSKRIYEQVCIARGLSA